MPRRGGQGAAVWGQGCLRWPVADDGAILTLLEAKFRLPRREQAEAFLDRRDLGTSARFRARAAQRVPIYRRRGLLSRRTPRYTASVITPPPTRSVSSRTRTDADLLALRLLPGVDLP